jgi:thiopeptide-type bacteriocin biosynthesis protein
MLEEGDAAHDERWRLALFGIDALLQDFGLGIQERLRTVSDLRKGFGAEVHEDAVLRRGLGDRFRKEKSELLTLLDPEKHQANPLWPGLEVFLHRSARMAPIVQGLRGLEEEGHLVVPVDGLVPSFVHMHVNRLLCESHRKHELVLYDFLGRLYRAREAARTSERRVV